MESLWLFVHVAWIAAAAGFGFRLGWTFLPVAQAFVALILVIPEWIVSKAVFYFRKRFRA